MAEQTITERAAAYRADPVRYYSPNYQHDRRSIYSPGFLLLGIVNSHYDPTNEYSTLYISFDHHPIGLPLTWMNSRGGNAEANRNMTLRWRRI